MKLTDIQYSQILVYCFSKNIPFDSKENFENRNDDFISIVLNINNPTEKPTIKLIHTINQNIEKDLHKVYNNKRIRGEWFVLTKNDIKTIIDL